MLGSFGLERGSHRRGVSVSLLCRTLLLFRRSFKSSILLTVIYQVFDLDLHCLA